MKWHECDSCSAEFRVVSDTDELGAFCPFCGSDIDIPAEDDEDAEDYD